MADSERPSNDLEPEEHFSPESKVGLFVLAGLADGDDQHFDAGGYLLPPAELCCMSFLRNVEGITE